MDKSDWMWNLSDDALVSSLSIPGTHDSASYHCKAPLSTMAVTQKWNIDRQLRGGVRYFDLRVGLHKGELVFFHGSWQVAEETNLETTCNEFVQFLTQHPTEIIFAQIRLEHGGNEPEFGKLIYKIINQAPGYWDCDNGINGKKVRDYRKKIKLLCRFNPPPGAQPGPGVCVNGWPDKAKPGFFAGDEYILQDQYMATRGDKCRFVRECLQLAKDNPKKFCLNFVSGIYPRTPAEFHATEGLEKAAEYGNKRALKYLVEEHTGSTGVMLFDYIHEDIVQAVIDKN